VTDGIQSEQLVFIPVDEDVELWDVHIRNISDRPRHLSFFSYVEFSFHHIEIDNQNLQMSLYASGANFLDGIIEYDFFYEPWTFHYMTSSFTPESFDCVRDRFLGSYHTETNPEAVINGKCFGSSELGGNSCGALHKRLVLMPGQVDRFIFMLGVGDRTAGQAMRIKYSNFSKVDIAFSRLRDYWQKKLDVFQCKTPNPGLNTMVNIWNLYQAETCVVWSRFASFIEVGGRTGLGYRDTSQDVMSVPHTNPDKVRKRLVELLNGQVSRGYGLHLFDPEVFKPKENKLPGVNLPTIVPMQNPADIIHGLENTCSDDALWIIASVCEFIKETGDITFFDQVVPFADGGQASIYEHLKRSLDFSTEQVGSTGICKGLRADWNDCLNLGGGESAMVSFLHYWALKNFIEAASFLDRKQDVKKYTLIAEKVREACEDNLWDGEWYIRGITQKGIKIGSNENDEGKIFLESNTWAVVSEAAAPERAKSCMDAVDKYLFSPFGIHLVWPAYSQPDDDIGYITRVYKGIKENASIFSHPNPWAVIAECKLGRGDQAMKFYNALQPYNQNDLIETRQAEPYSYCQFIMGRDHPAFCLSRNPWLTGSDVWLYHDVTHWILGIRVSYTGLIVDPCIPSNWHEFEVVRQWRNATYLIKVKNPLGVQKGVRSIRLNGANIQNPIPQQPKGSCNHVTVEMG
jgi:N,N'-diacetylchitobiose phosphorylase